jgi:cystathionine beta-lyase/cystathionine gamma-synthase
MAAFSTILGFLQGEQKLNGPILVGKSCYFEEKNLLHALFPSQIVEVDEHDLAAIRAAIEVKKPVAVFFDSICNSQDMALPDLVTIVAIIRKQKRSDLILVVDNTGLSVMFQPLKLKHLHDPYVQIIVWESLLKYHQFGMDRVNGGIIYSSAQDDIKLYDYRDHLGTNIAESVVTSLPTPNSKLLKKRLSRHGRNIRYLAKAVPDRIAFPGLPLHPSFSWSQTLPFHGAILTVLFHKDRQKLHTYKRFLHLIIESARKENITVVAGSSFGFSITRVYIPASYGYQANPFLRIAVGTEPEFVFQKIAKILQETYLTIR